MTGKSAGAQRQKQRPPQTTSPAGDGRRNWLVVLVVALAIAALTLAVVSAPSDDEASNTGNEASDAGDGVSYDVGSPGTGEQAPEFTLASTTGDEISLADYRGSAVLLYFQEGLMCQACWDQLSDLEQDIDKVHAAGIDDMLSITTDPIDLLTRKVADDGLSTPTASDPDLEVSRTYETNLYGMMGEARNGHSFILVGPDGTIQWRADYGGEPDYTMYVPVDELLADLEAGRQS